MSISRFDISACNGELHIDTTGPVEGAQGKTQVVDPGFSQDPKPEVCFTKAKVEVSSTLNELICQLPWDIGEAFRLVVETDETLKQLKLSYVYQRALSTRSGSTAVIKQSNLDQGVDHYRVLVELLQSYADISYFATQASNRLLAQANVEPWVKGSEFKCCSLGLLPEESQDNSRRLVFLAAYPLLFKAFEIGDSQLGLSGSIWRISPKSFEAFTAAVNEQYQELKYCAHQLCVDGEDWCSESDLDLTRDDVERSLA